MRQNLWAFAPLLTLLSTLASASNSINMLKDPIQVSALLIPSYSPIDNQICHYNGIRYTSCSQATNLVPLTTAQRSALSQLLQSCASSAGGMQIVLYAMSADLVGHVQNPQRDCFAGTDCGTSRIDPSLVSKYIEPTQGKKAGLNAKKSDIDPTLLGKAVQKKLHIPPVTESEEECYRNWFKQKGMGEDQVNLVLNELWVGHVGRAMDKVKQQLKIVHGTGCSPLADGRKAKAGDALEKKGGVKKRETQKDSEEMKWLDDDMKVYHPVHGTHLDEPWLRYREVPQHERFVGGYGNRKRSIGGGYLVTHRHRTRDGQQQPGGQKHQGGLLPTGADASSYYNGMPSNPIPSSSSAHLYSGSGSGSGTGTGTGTALTSRPHGFAASATGGGSAPPVIPKSPSELFKLLTDPQPRVIHLDRTYDFRTTAGVCTNCAGCIPDSYAKCPSKGQLAIDNGQGWCKDKPFHAVTYDKAGLTPIRMGPNKSVIGITANAGIRGKGLLIAHQKNVILQGFAIELINPEFIWGGDGVTIRDSDLVWIDRIMFRLIGRQFIVTGYESAGRVTISNSFFDCQTKWSATCDDSHYWTVLGYGKSDRVTFSGNIMKHCSGRSPRIANPDNQGGDSVWHVVNSAFEGSTGHSFDLGPGVSALIEGNVFNDIAQTSLHESSPGRAFAPSDKALCSQCKAMLGRDCQPNAYIRANPIPSTSSAGVVLKDVVGEKMVKALTPDQVEEQIASTAGCNGATKAVATAHVGGDQHENYGARAQASGDASAVGATTPYIADQQASHNGSPEPQHAGGNPWAPASHAQSYGQPDAQQQKQAQEEQKKQAEQQQKEQQKQQEKQQKKQAEEQKKQQHEQEEEEKKKQQQQQQQQQQGQQH
ncbi:hypothetical protein NDA18_000460 [Ustilago nuda]|nr:hypothetical protein NDA18_000460 [Ustilago nuda]